MSNEDRKTLRMAVLIALRGGGTQLLEQPERLKGYVMDYADPDLKEVRAFERNCDEELLEIYKRAAEEKSPAAIGEAATKATYLLSNERMLQSEIAGRVACETAFALANLLGIVCPESVRLKALHTESASDSAASSQNGASGTRQPGTWYEAQQARQKPQQNQTASQRYAAERGSSTGGAPNAYNASPGGASASTSTSGAASSQQTGAGAAWINPDTLSDDRVTRQKQIEEAGIGMRGFEWIKVCCWINAAIQIYNGVTCYTAATPMLKQESLALWQLLWFETIAMFVLAIAYIVAWGCLSKFRRNGPSAFFWTLAISAILPLVFFGIASSIMNPSPETPMKVPSEAILWLLVDVVLLCMTYDYFKSRKQFFTL